MIEIDGKIVSTDIITEKFLCDLSRCKGICCVEGNAGAPLEADEARILADEYPLYKPYMTPEGVAAVEAQGFAVVDEDGDLVTPLVGDAECAYSYRAAIDKGHGSTLGEGHGSTLGEGHGSTLGEDNGLTISTVNRGSGGLGSEENSPQVTLCAIERAWAEGRTTFRKPVSCHLYPIRVARFGDGSLGLNYHRWAVCEGALELGRKKGVPMFRMLRDAIVRRFGEDFYQALEAAEAYLKK